MCPPWEVRPHEHYVGAEVGVVVVVDAAMVVIDLLAARRLSYDCCRHVGRVPSCDLFDAMASTLRSR